MRNIDDWIVNISNTSYKFSKSTIVKANKSIEYIKKNKKLYRYCVIYLAVCLMPVFANVGKELIYEFIMAMSNVPSDMLFSECFKLFLEITKFTTIILISFEVLKSFISNTVKQITK